MDEAEGAANRWELSKENIQPLKQGRKATVLSVALDESAARKLNAERHVFEEELRTYSGDDPLDVWYRYVLWVEQNYPKGGKEGNIMKLIEKCVTALHTSKDTHKKYDNDSRFLELWIKYANLCPSPVEIYQTLEAKGMCTGLAEFYMSWAWEIEKVGNYKRADAIYQKGLQCGAKPLDVLEDAQKKFQMRVARSTLEGKLVETDTSSSEAQRGALTSLKPQGRKHHVPTERVGANVIGPAGRVAVAPPTSNRGGPSFQIFQDTGGQSVASQREGSGAALPIRTAVNKENVKDPGVWSKAKASQRTTPVVAVEDLNKYQKPAFSLHEDDQLSQPTITPAKLPQTSNVLSIRKREFEEWNVPMFISEPFDPKVQPQYCKHKVYCGTEEFSFEELRAAKFFKKRKEEEKKNAELQQMQDMLKKQEEMIQQLLQERLSQQKREESQLRAAEMVSPSEPALEISSVRRKREDRKAENMGRNIYHDSWVAINKSVNASVNYSVNVSHLLDESTTSALLQCQPAVASPCSKESSHVQEPSLSVPAPLPTSRDNSNLSSSSNSRGLNITDPTVNTKMAMNMINEMWSASLFKDDLQQDTNSLGQTPEPEPKAAAKASAPFSIFQDSNPSHSGKDSDSAPFTIFTDTSDKKPVKSDPFMIFSDEVESAPKKQEIKPCQPFAIFSDAEACKVPDPNDLYLDDNDENDPPAGFVQPKEFRSTSGILQPATNIPVLIVEEANEPEVEEEKVEGAVGRGDGTRGDLERDDDYLDDIVPLNGGNLADLTLKMPKNPEAFAKMAKVASTPGPWSLGCVPQATTNGDDFTMAVLKIRDHFPEIRENEEKEDSGELMPPPPITQAPPSSPIPKPTLSPIMEASREYRSSSTSSSSGYSTTSTTLGGHTVHGITQQGGLSTTHISRSRHNSHTQIEFALENGGPAQTGDFTKSGYLADKSRGESLAETKPSFATQFRADDKDDFDPREAAVMLMNMDEMPQSLAESTRIDAREPRHVSACKTQKPKLPDVINPFDEDLLQTLLLNMEQPVEERGGFVLQQGKMPQVKPNSQVTLGGEMFHVRRLRGEGAYAKVYQASTLDPMNVTILPSLDDSDDEDEEEDDEKQMILKVQKPFCPWEFYICHELRERLKAEDASLNMLDSVMRINRGYFYNNGSILVNQYHKYGTILDIVNRYKVAGKTVPEELAMYFMVEVLSILEALHSCNIIHADIKPDNFLIRNTPVIDATASSPAEMFASCPSSVKLIDFGRSIDMQLFPEGTTFVEKVTTEGFSCCEMREGKPWTYQTDLYGAAAIAFCLLFGSYMDVKKSMNGQWELKGVTLKRYWKKELWQLVFSTLLNVPSCSAVPSLSKLKQKIMTTFFENGMQNEFNVKVQQLFTMMIQKS
ncbi:uncharacterized protein LOC125029042 [Penaeus chinensis]|uniref:uncharacterized protein LOC125029042 n=1 Tax=Penaeus chinensis TaxID=139456 RepID=UPI001FB756C9|nr:uncharacterized protein LOC125029042 [Penaeus chinensis]XP_047474734.1 uncharacterized protein LOC125029042 [Penaeus chinensis]XP_047474736.1 uncharacterized protein LOC125029042 [Penaeus chinensis]